MPEKLIYVADDEPHIQSIIRSFLEKDGYRVQTFQDGVTLWEAFCTVPADMLILDIMMPRIDGLTLLNRIRERSAVPVIMVSARDTDYDKVSSLKTGCDDYLTKPFSPLELNARVASLFRRIDMEKGSFKSQPAMRLLDLEILPMKKQVLCNGTNLGLTGMETELLIYLVNNRNRAVDREELLEKVWGFETHVETRATDDMVKRIRRKLTDAGSQVRIETVWGFGFMIGDAL